MSKRLTLELLSVITHLSALEAWTGKMPDFVDHELISSDKRQFTFEPDLALISTCSGQTLDLSCLVLRQTI